MNVAPFPGRSALLVCIAAAGFSTMTSAPITGQEARPGDDVPGIVKRVAVAAPGGEAAAVVVDAVPLAHTAQMLPVDDAGRLLATADVAGQAAAVLDRLDHTLRGVGSRLDHAIKVNVYLDSTDSADTVRRVLDRRFPTPGPVATWVTTHLPLDGALVGMDAIATVAAETDGGTPDARPAGAGPAVALGPPAPGTAPRLAAAAVLPAGSRVYVAGQAEKGDLGTAMRDTLASLLATLEFLDVGPAQIVQIKSFIAPMSDVAAAEEEIVAWFAERPVPPLVWVEWQSPAELPIEIELVVAANPARDAAVGPVEYLTPPGMTTSPIFSRAVRVHHPRTIYTGGLWGPAEADGATQVAGVFDALAALSAAAGGDLRHLAKATYYVSDDDASRRLNELRPKYYDPRRPPAASKAAVRGVARPGRSITIDMIGTPRP